MLGVLISMLSARRSLGFAVRIVYRPDHGWEELCKILFYRLLYSSLSTGNRKEQNYSQKNVPHHDAFPVF